MYLNKLLINNFKNIEQAELDFSQSLNCFIGDNGEGKTNLLDAIHYLSITKSFFYNTDQQNIKHGEKYFIIQGLYKRNNLDEKIYCATKIGESKMLKRNDKEYSRFADHIGIIPLVMISPTDVSLIVDSGEERRKYINGVISQLDKNYLDDLIKYNRILQQRNKLLKQQTINDDVLNVLDEQLSNYAYNIFEKRKAFIEQIQPYFEKVYAQISDDKEKVSVEYKSDLQHGNFVYLLKKSYEKDRILQHTTAGVHRDDIEMKIGKYPIKKNGSQGQQKTYLIALKLTQFNFLKNKMNLAPILLLDDIFDKLDLNRVERLIDLVANNGFGQIFLTDSNKTRLEKILAKQQNPFSIFKVKQGEFSKI